MSNETANAKPLAIAAHAPAPMNRDNPSEGSASEGTLILCCCVIVICSFRFSWLLRESDGPPGRSRDTNYSTPPIASFSQTLEVMSYSGAAGVPRLGGIEGTVVAGGGAGLRQAFRSKTTNPIATALA